MVITIFAKTALIAQQPITGLVIDEQNTPVPFANVILLKARDTTMINGTTSTEEGKFELMNSSDKPVLVQVSLLGYKDFFSGSIAPDSATDLGTIQLEVDTQMLSEVVIRGELPLIQQKIDRTVVNVQGAVSSAGNTTLNVLSKAPSVTVNRSTNQISMMGKQGVLVMMDDKQMRMDMPELISFLDNMPADNINTIELITSPPASYDAQGVAGIINITTIRKTGEGWVGSYSVNTAYGDHAKYGGSLNLSYQKDKIYFFANASGNLGNLVENVVVFADYDTTEEQVLMDLTSARRPFMGLYTGEAGLDYQLSERTTIGVLASLNIRDWTMDAISESDIRSTETGNFIEIIESVEENFLFRTLLNFNFRHKFSETSNISLNYDNIGFERENPTDYDAIRVFDDGREETNEFISDTETPLDINVFKLDFSTASSEKLTLETGAKAALSEFQNDVEVSNLVGDVFVEDDRFTDVFELDEDIYAAYISTDFQVNPKFLIRTGLRYEYYHLDLSVLNQGQIVDRIQNNLFPSISLNYMKSEDNEWNLSYVQRIERPSFLNLAPFFYFYNQNTLFTGNPNLIPAILNQFKLDYRYKRLNLSLQYTDTSDPIFNWQAVLEGNPEALVFKAQQGEENRVVAFTADLPWKINSWWSSRYNLLLNYLDQIPIIDSEPVTERNTSFILTTVQSFDLGKEFNLEISGELNSAQYEGLIRTEPRPTLDVGIRKRFQSGASLALNVTDVFDTSSEWNFVGDNPQDDIFYDWLFDNEGPIVRLSFSMPFGSNIKRDKRERESGSEEEQRRLN